MASTYSIITVVPPSVPGIGTVPVDVTILNPAGSTATAYTTRDGSTAFTFPATVSVETSFYLTTVGDHSVSALAGSQEVATESGSPAIVRAVTSSRAEVVRAFRPLDSASTLATTLAADEAFTSQYVLLAEADRVDGEGPVWDSGTSAWVSAAGGGGGGGTDWATPALIATVTGTADTLASGDLGYVNRYTNTSLVTVTLPTDAADDLVDGFWCVLVAEGTAGLTVSTTGVTLPAGTKKTVAQGETIVAIKTASANTWILTGGTLA